MAISGPNIGTSAFNETGKRYMSEARAAVRLPATPGPLSQMIGRSVEVNLSIGANNSYNRDTLITWMRAQGTAPVVITITGNIVSVNTAQACLEFPSNLTNEYVQLNINSGVTVYGRGGNSVLSGTGLAGGRAIYNAIGTRLRINNKGAIAGGGGGGGGAYWASSVSTVRGAGGGGRPFGVAATGGNIQNPPTNATLTAPGKGAGPAAGFQCGAGGNVGQAGGKSSGSQGSHYGGGAAGAAVAGSAPTWQALGTIYGTRV